MTTPAGNKRRELFDLISKVQRSTTNPGMLTICQALHSMLVTAAGDAAEKPVLVKPKDGDTDDYIARIATVAGCKPTLIEVLAAVGALKKRVDAAPKRVVSTSIPCPHCERRKKARAKAQKKWRKQQLEKKPKTSG